MPETEALLRPVESRVGRPLVVCVDDEPQILGALARLLRKEPYEVWTTSDPDEALDWVRNKDVTLIVADYRMPVMSGTTLLQIARASSPQTARLMLTGYPGESLVISAGEAGLMTLMGKPWDDDKLKTVIQNLVAGVEDDDPMS